MSESASLNEFAPGPVRRVTVTGFDGPDVLVVGETGVGRISQGELSSRRWADDPAALFSVGQELDVEEIGRWRGALHFSARACENPSLRAFLVGLRPGQIVTGTVAQVHNFGVFVHLDGEPDGLCTGFIRVPDLTWARINHPSEALAAGERVTAQVVHAETREGQVTISLTALLEDPLIRFAEQEGRVLRGTVTMVIPFGVFVRVAPDVEGLLHRTELTGRDLAEGDEITVRVAEVDRARHRVRLTCAEA